MDSSYIIAFAKSLETVFDMMLHSPITLGKPELDSGRSPEFEVSGVVGISGDITGSVVMGISKAVGSDIVERLTGEKFAATSEDYADAIGELINMVAGGAKSKFKDCSASITCPQVVISTGHRVYRPKSTPTVRFNCASNMGDFILNVTLEETKSQAA